MSIYISFIGISLLFIVCFGLCVRTILNKKSQIKTDIGRAHIPLMLYSWIYPPIAAYYLITFQTQTLEFWRLVRGLDYILFSVALAGLLYKYAKNTKLAEVIYVLLIGGIIASVAGVVGSVQHQHLLYYTPRYLIYGAAALSAIFAIRKRSILLFSFSFMGIALSLSCIAKWLKSVESTLIPEFVKVTLFSWMSSGDTTLTMISYAILFAGIFEKELFRIYDTVKGTNTYSPAEVASVISNVHSAATQAVKMLERINISPTAPAVIVPQLMKDENEYLTLFEIKEKYGLPDDKSAALTMAAHQIVKRIENGKDVYSTIEIKKALGE